MINSPENRLHVEEISCPDSFQELRDRWRDLESSVSHPSVFLTHEWFSAAWEWQKRHGQLSVLIVWQADELVGACPFLTTSAREDLLKYRKLEFLAVPDSQECSVLAKTALELQVHKAIFDHLAARQDWDIVEVRQLPDHAYTSEFLASQRAGPGIRTRFQSGGTNPTVPISGTWQDYYARRSKRLKKGNNHLYNKLKRQYSEISVECHNYTDWSDSQIRQICEELVNISIRSWKSQETQTSFDHEGPRAWMESVSRSAAENGWLAVWTLQVDGTCVATEMQLVRNGVVSALRADFDNDLRDLSPGAYLNWKILEHLFSQHIGGVGEYRMGPGTNPYKARWSERDLSLVHAVLYNSTARAQVLWLVAEHIKPALRKLIEMLSRQREKLASLFRDRNS